jgi:ATP-dependent RNA helicase DDX24/MAK5
LYYFLSRRPGKTLVFVNAISCLRRLIALFIQLGIPVIPLHANLQQRQRLKNLDRFKAHPRAVAICTDVAARGLDIQGVEYVVHYQLPRSSESYVHRCGRTARAGNTGMSLALVGPKDQKSYRKICHVLNKEKGIPFMVPEQGFMEMIQDRVNLARKVDLGLNKLNKEQVQTEWLRKTAAEAGLVCVTH